MTTKTYLSSFWKTHNSYLKTHNSSLGSVDYWPILKLNKTQRQREIWKCANVVPVHKKNEKNIKSNYRPISLLPIFGKVLEKLIYDSLYSHLVSRDLLNPNQSGFRPGDSTVNQLISITHNFQSI